MKTPSATPYCRAVFRTFGAAALPLFFAALTGCVRLPAALPVAEGLRADVEAAFAGWAAGQEGCDAAFDAVATVRLVSPRRSGTMEGNLVALPPARLKFIGVNPFGQPQLLFTTDGTTFQLVSVPEAKAYAGSVKAEKFARYAPPGFEAGEIVLWLAGRFPLARMTIEELGEDREGLGFWLRFRENGGGFRHHVLFDQKQLVVRRHVVTDRLGRKTMDTTYDDYLFLPDGGGRCTLPGRVGIEELPGGSSMSIFLDEVVGVAGTDFSIRVPAGFVEEKVQ